jgi:hypothetical protein
MGGSGQASGRFWLELGLKDALLKGSKRQIRAGYEADQCIKWGRKGALGRMDEWKSVHPRNGSRPIAPVSIQRSVAPKIY